MRPLVLILSVLALASGLPTGTNNDFDEDFDAQLAEALKDLDLRAESNPAPAKEAVGAPLSIPKPVVDELVVDEPVEEGPVEEPAKKPVKKPLKTKKPKTKPAETLVDIRAENEAGTEESVKIEEPGKILKPVLKPLLRPILKPWFLPPMWKILGKIFCENLPEDKDALLKLVKEKVEKWVASLKLNQTIPEEFKLKVKTELVKLVTAADGLCVAEPTEEQKAGLKEKLKVLLGAHYKHILAILRKREQIVRIMIQDLKDVACKHGWETIANILKTMGLDPDLSQKVLENLKKLKVVCEEPGVLIEVKEPKKEPTDVKTVPKRFIKLPPAVANAIKNAGKVAKAVWNKLCSRVDVDKIADLVGKVLPTDMKKTETVPDLAKGLGDIKDKVCGEVTPEDEKIIDTIKIFANVFREKVNVALARIRDAFDAISEHLEEAGKILCTDGAAALVEKIKERATEAGHGDWITPYIKEIMIKKAEELKGKVCAPEADVDTVDEVEEEIFAAAFGKKGAILKKVVQLAKMLVKSHILAMRTVLCDKGTAAVIAKVKEVLAEQNIVITAKAEEALGKILENLKEKVCSDEEPMTPEVERAVLVSVLGKVADIVLKGLTLKLREKMDLEEAIPEEVEEKPAVVKEKPAVVAEMRDFAEPADPEPPVKPPASKEEFLRELYQVLDDI